MRAKEKAPYGTAIPVRRTAKNITINLSEKGGVVNV